VKDGLPSTEALLAAASALPRLPRLEDDPGGPVMVGVSGGADSVYLLLALAGDPALAPRLTVAHFDHRVRGAKSAADADFVARLCSALGIPLRPGRRTVAGAATEGELRRAREEFFAEVRASVGASTLVTAHHLDDVVETVLLRLARGAGPGGLGSPRVRRLFRDGHVRWRPLVAAGLRKRDLVAALRAAGVPWREDATNLLPVTSRNRVRAWLGAGAEAALGEGHAAGFGLSASILAASHEALLAWAAELGCVPGVERLDLRGLRGRPAALAHAVLAEHVRALIGSDASASSLAPLVSAAVAGGQGRFSLCGRLFRLRAGILSLVVEPLAWGRRTRPLLIGVADPECGLLAELADVGPGLWTELTAGRISNSGEVYVRLPSASLVWRGRVEGDRYRPLGAPGGAKVSGMLINRKVPAEVRESLPVVLAGDQILWVPGLPPCEMLSLKGPCRGALRLTWPAGRVA
jgi:tRNA(Ile)-lysidine synthase